MSKFKLVPGPGISNSEESLLKLTDLRAHFITDKMVDFYEEATEHADDLQEDLLNKDFDIQRESKIMLIQNNGVAMHIGNRIRQIVEFVEDSLDEAVASGTFGRLNKRDSKQLRGVLDFTADLIVGEVMVKILDNADEFNKVIAGDRDKELAKEK